MAEQSGDQREMSKINHFQEKKKNTYDSQL